MRQMALIPFALFIAVSVVHQANAQAMSYILARHSNRFDPAVNNYLSAVYDHRLQVDPHFRSWRMWKECHIIDVNWPPLYADCLASFDQYEPMLAGYRRHY